MTYLHPLVAPPLLPLVRRQAQFDFFFLFCKALYEVVDIALDVAACYAVSADPELSHLFPAYVSVLGVASAMSLVNLVLVSRVLMEIYGEIRYGVNLAAYVRPPLPDGQGGGALLAQEDLPVRLAYLRRTLMIVICTILVTLLEDVPLSVMNILTLQGIVRGRRVRVCGVSFSSGGGGARSSLLFWFRHR